MDSSRFHQKAPLIRKLERTFILSDDERAALENLQMQVQDLSADQALSQHSSLPECR